MEETKDLQEGLENVAENLAGAEELKEEKGEPKEEKRLSKRRSTGRMAADVDIYLNSMYQSYKNKKAAESEHGVSDEGAENPVEEFGGISAYEYLQTNGTIFDVAFEMRNPVDGTFMDVTEDGVTLVLRQKKQSRSFRRNSDYVIGRTLKVRVDEIDKENQIVYVVCDSMIDSGASRLRTSIDSALERGEQPLVSGTVVAVVNGLAVVDIFDKGIFGGCLYMNWRGGYIQKEDFKKHVELNQVYDFYVTGQNRVKRKDGKGYDNRYFLTRKADGSGEVDYWEKLGKNKPLCDVLANRGSVLVRCISIPKNKSYWWGKVDSIEGIDIMCDYSVASRNLEVGRYYRCVVSEFDLEKHRLKCTAFASAKENNTNTAVSVAKKLKRGAQALENAQKKMGNENNEMKADEVVDAVPEENAEEAKEIVMAPVEKLKLPEQD